MRKSKHIVAVTTLIVLATVGLFVIFKLIFQMPLRASAEAVIIDGLIDVHFAMMAFLFALIMVIVLYAGFVFRLKEDEDPGETFGTHTEGNYVLEIVWTIVPTITVIIFGVYAIILLGEILAPKPNEMVVHITGRQWSWSFNYPEIENKGNADLVLPVNQPILLEMESEDVLHNFWVPEFRVKQDLVPGSTQILRFTPTEVGEYKLRCAEICGLQHAIMLANVHVVSEEQWDAFVQELIKRPLLSELTPEERGEFWWSATGLGCQACHSIDGSPSTGPTWYNLVGREEPLTDGTTAIADEDYIVNSILHPGDQIVVGYTNIMPANYEEVFAQREAEILASEGVEISILEDILAFMNTLHEDVNAN